MYLSFVRICNHGLVSMKHELRTCFHDPSKIVPFKILVQMATDIEVGMAVFRFRMIE